MAPGPDGGEQGSARPVRRARAGRARHRTSVRRPVGRHHGGAGPCHARASRTTPDDGGCPVRRSHRRGRAQSLARRRLVTGGSRGVAQRGRRGRRGAVPGGDPRLRGVARRGRPRRTRRPVAARRRPRRVGGGARVHRGGRGTDRSLRGRRLPAELGGAARARQTHGARGGRRRDRRPHGHAGVLGPRFLPLDPGERESVPGGGLHRPGRGPHGEATARRGPGRPPAMDPGARAAPAGRGARGATERPLVGPADLERRSCECSSSCRPT